MSVERILEALDRHEPAALARAITLVENQRDGFERVLSHAHARLARGAARRIGITGPPGAGKSTLTERLIQHYRGQGLSVGVVAVDPTSPFTGGALLGTASGWNRRASTRTSSSAPWPRGART